MHGGSIPFVGRTVELQVLADELVKADQRRPRVVLLEGEAGVGKTSLVGQFLDRTSHVTVLRAVGDPSLRTTSYGTVSQLSPRVGGSFEQHGAVKDPLQVGAQLLEAISERQGARPVCIVVDDVHEADVASLRALLFALRRLQQDRVLAILVSRSESTQFLPDGFRQLATIAGQRIELGGLSYADFQTIASSMHQPPLSARSMRRLWEHTAGNPLHAWGVARRAFAR